MRIPEILYDFCISQDDPATELRALNLSLGDRVLCVASAGEVPLELLVNSDESIKIDAVDISGPQLYLSNLKFKAAMALKGTEAARFWAPEMNQEVFQKNLEQRPSFGIENYMLALADNQIVGVCSAWDMMPFKKNRILEYGVVFGMTRLLHNTAAPLLGIPLLPKAGEAFRDITIAEYAVRD